MIEWATEKGLKEGRAKGIAKGRDEGRVEGRVEGERSKAIEIAKNMLALGLEVAVIAKASGLSEAEVESLKSEK